MNDICMGVQYNRVTRAVSIRPALVGSRTVDGGGAERDVQLLELREKAHDVVDGQRPEQDLARRRRQVHHVRSSCVRLGATEARRVFKPNSAIG